MPKKYLSSIFVFIFFCIWFFSQDSVGGGGRLVPSGSSSPLCLADTSSITGGFGTATPTAPAAAGVCHSASPGRALNIFAGFSNKIAEEATVCDFFLSQIYFDFRNAVSLFRASFFSLCTPSAIGNGLHEETSVIKHGALKPKLLPINLW